MSQFECSICKDTRHVLKDGGWVRCSCLYEREKALRYAQAGITQDASLLTLENYSKQCPASFVDSSVLEVMTALNTSFQNKKRFIPERMWCFQGTPNSPKDFMVQCLLKSAVDGGLKVKQAFMTDIIRKHFNDDEADFSLVNDFINCDLFVISFGTEIQVNVASSFLNELVRAHNNNIGKHCLMLHTTLALNAIGSKYGDETKSYFARYHKDTDEQEKKNRRIMFASTEGI